MLAGANTITNETLPYFSDFVHFSDAHVFAHDGCFRNSCLGRQQWSVSVDIASAMPILSWMRWITSTANREQSRMWARQLRKVLISIPRPGGKVKPNSDVELKKSKEDLFCEARGS